MKIRIKITYEKPKIAFQGISSWLKDLRRNYPHRFRGMLLISFLCVLTILMRYSIVMPILNSYYKTEMTASSESLRPLQKIVSIESYVASELSTNIKGIFSHNQKKNERIKTDVGFVDLRVITLEDFFNSYGSPLSEYADDFIEASERYNIENWQLLPAIAINETNGCQTGISFHQKNCWGWGGGPKNRISFDSFEEAIDTISYGMITSYGNERMNARDIQRTYCGPNCMQQGWKWARGVNSYVRLINNYGEVYGLERSNEISEFPPV